MASVWRMQTAQQPASLLVAERGHQLHVLKVEDLQYIESCGNYVTLHARAASYISRDSVKRLASVLAGAGFVRIERSLLVNLRAVRHAQRLGRGSFALTLLSGSRLRSGSSYREHVARELGDRRGAGSP
jgi:two-component system, LytTR family, response regulator